MIKVKKLGIIVGAILLSFGSIMTSYAANESSSYQQSYLEMLKEEVEKKRELVEETLPAELEELENVTIPELEEELEEARAAYEKDLEENPHNVNGRLKLKMEVTENELEDKKMDIDRIKSEIETEKYHLSELEKQLEQRTNMAYGNYWTGEVPTYNSNRGMTQKFKIMNYSGNYVLLGEYRTWNKLMGGSWMYDDAVTDTMDISFYEGSECLESSLSRVENYDTETQYAWDLPDDLSSSNDYDVEINGQRYGLYMYDGSNSSSSSKSDKKDDYEDDEFDAGEEENNTTDVSNQTEQTAISTVDYPGFYDATLADGIPNQTYYAQATDGGWTVVIGTNFVEYSEYDKNNQRGNSNTVKGWLYKDGKWYAFNGMGQQVTGWIPCGGYWYCVIPTDKAETSYMVTGWQELNGKWYYFNTSGQMVANCVVDGYTIGTDGVWVQ